MIIESKQLHAPLAIGLRWLVATPAEIEYIKDRTDLQYGIVQALSGQSSRKYKNAALASAEHDKSYSLAAMLAEKYEQLIYVQKLASDYYWLCVIKNHRVWNDIDIGEQTAGDLLGTRDKISAAVAMARDEFSAANIDLSGCTYSTNLSEGEFTALSPIKFNDLISNITKHRRHRIKLIESYRRKTRQFLMIIALVAVCGGVGYYIYSTQNAAAQLRASQARQALAAQQALQARLNYFRQLDVSLDTQQGSRVIERFLQGLEKMDLQSQGWQVSAINYQASQAQQAEVQLTRGPYGDVLSFARAFAAQTIGQQINADNNSGSKTLQLTVPAPVSALTTLETTRYQQMLTEKSAEQRLLFVAYAQRHALPVAIQTAQTGQYQIQSSSFSVSGTQLWNLRKYQYIFKQFPTLIVKTINLTVDPNRQITWQLEGEIYG